MVHGTIYNGTMVYGTLKFFISIIFISIGPKNSENLSIS